MAFSTLCKISANYYKLLIMRLFADAEVFEDVGEDFVGGDFASGDFTKMVEALAKVFGNEVARDVVGNGVLHPGNGFERVVEGFVMTEVGDYGVVASVGV